MTRENENGQEKRENAKRNTRKTNAEVKNNASKKVERTKRTEKTERKMPEKKTVESKAGTKTTRTRRTRTTEKTTKLPIRREEKSMVRHSRKATSLVNVKSEENLQICHCVPDEHGCAHHAAGADGGTEQQPVLYAGDQRGDERAERCV